MKKHILILIPLMVIVFPLFINAQKSKKSSESALDEKKLSKAEEYIAKAMDEKDKEKQSALLTKANDLFREMKMIKEGAQKIGDAFYNAGNLPVAQRWYAKAGKDVKKDLNEKVGEAYLQEALKGSNDPKEEKKNMAKAIQSLTKAHGAEEAYRLVGNEFFDMGKEHYPKAIEYYEKANYTEGVIMIADIYAAKSETRDLAAETYARTKTYKGYKKAGDLYYNTGNYMKAMDYYTQGGVIEGYLKFAGELKKAGKIDDMNKVYYVVSDTLIAKGKPDDVYEFALMAEKDNNYDLASELYKKLNNKELHLKYKAKLMMRDLKYIEAKQVYTEMGRPSMVSAIDQYVNHLTDLYQLKLTLDELQRNVPKLTIKQDPSTGAQEYDKRDVNLREQYYANSAVSGEISKTIFKVSDIAAKIKNTELLDAVKECFMQYKPVSNLLDANLAKKVSPKNVTPSMITF